MSLPLASPVRLPSAPPARVGAGWTERLTLLLESTGEGVFGVDVAGRCTFINRAGAQMLGWRTEEVLGRNMHALIHHSRRDGAHYPEADCPIFNAFRRGLPCRIDSEVLWRADGSSFCAEYSSHPMLDGGAVRARWSPSWTSPSASSKVATGGLFITPSVAEHLAVSVATGAAQADELHERLSHREYQVFRLLTTGRSVGEIAEQLALSSNTVSTYRARILEKTGARNDVELALYAVRAQLLPA